METARLEAFLGPDRKQNFMQEKKQKKKTQNIRLYKNTRPGVKREHRAGKPYI